MVTWQQILMWQEHSNQIYPQGPVTSDRKRFAGIAYILEMLRQGNISERESASFYQNLCNITLFYTKIKPYKYLNGYCIQGRILRGEI
jgi:hypothetical protein